MKRTIYAYDLLIKPQRGKLVKVPDSYEKDIVSILSKICKYSKKNKAYKYDKDRKILYVNSVSYEKNSRILKLVFVSARYGVVRNVMNTLTFVERGKLKQKPDGDLEKTHIIIKFDEDNRAIALYEYNSDGISFPKIIDYLNEYVKAFHEKKQDMIYYKMSHENIVSRDFLQSLEKIKRVKAVTLTIDQEDIGVSDSKRFAGRNDISEDIDIVLKPAARGLGIRGTTVKEFYELYNNKGMPIKRITVKGDRDTKDPLTFDTEKMKEKYPIDVLEDPATGEVDTKDIFQEMRQLCKYF